MRGPVAAVMSTGTLVALVFGYQASQILRSDDATNASVKENKADVAPMPTVPPAVPSPTVSTPNPAPRPGESVPVSIASTAPVAYPSYDVSVAPPPPPNSGVTGPPHDDALPSVTRLPYPGSTLPTPSATTTAANAPKTFTGDPSMTQWGPMQVRITTAHGRVTGVTVVQRPGGLETSETINNKLIPYLNAQVMQKQSMELDGISGATISTRAYLASLQSAINQWKNL